MHGILSTILRMWKKNMFQLIFEPTMLLSVKNYNYDLLHQASDLLPVPNVFDLSVGHEVA